MTWLCLGGCVEGCIEGCCRSCCEDSAGSESTDQGLFVEEDDDEDDEDDGDAIRLQEFRPSWRHEVSFSSFSFDLSGLRS